MYLEGGEHFKGMVRVLVLVNDISPSSIPFELSVEIARTTDTEVVICSFFDDRLDDILDKISIGTLPVEIIPLGGTSRFDRHAWSAFRSELVNNYNLVHTHQNFSGSVARLLARLEGAPIVNTEHRAHQSFSLLQNLVNAPTLPLATHVVSNSHATQDSFRWYERIVLNDERLSVIHNGVDLSRINRALDHTDRLNEDTFRIVSVGRMVPVKNQSTLLLAFSLFSEDSPNSELVMVGDGPVRGQLEKMAGRLGISESVRFTGKVSRQRVYELLGASDVFVISSEAEGFCVAAVEAMAAGLPVIASDIPVFHEVLGDCGIFVKPDQPAEFSRVIQELRENDERRSKIGERGAERVSSHFSLDRVAQQYYELYLEVLENSS